MTDQERIKAAVALILQYGDVDGEHHKQWLLDQTLRTLLAPEDYAAAISEYETVEDDEFTGAFLHSEWDRGIAP